MQIPAGPVHAASVSAIEKLIGPLCLEVLLSLVPVLIRVSIVVKKHCEHSNCSKRKHLTLVGLQLPRFSKLLSWWEERQYAGRHGVEDVAEISTS